MATNTIKRPLSPHLTIYQPQLTSILSIVHRATGSMLVIFYIGYFILGDLNFVYGLSHNTFFRGCLRGQVTIFIQLIVFAGRSYHFFNGIRHFLWDSGLFLDLSSVYRTGWTVVGLTSVLTGIFYIFVNSSVPVFRS
jgi:succinate dehydrogenase / fumarate reductase, cytochrome b subunit